MISRNASQDVFPSRVDAWLVAWVAAAIAMRTRHVAVASVHPDVVTLVLSTCIFRHGSRGACVPYGQKHYIK